MPGPWVCRRMRPLVPAAGLVALACAGAATGAASSTAGCEVRPAGPTGPVTDPGGPYYHQVVLASTADGLVLAGARQILDHASVPDGVRLADGTVRIYYVNGADGAVWVARVMNDSATVLGAVILNGVERPAGLVDPDATPLESGAVRLFYLSGFGSPGGTAPRAICAAESADGLRFTFVARALELPAASTVTDPSVTPLPGGDWLMALSLGQRTLLARSGDGLAFSIYDTVSYGGVPELATLGDGSVRLYVCAQGIESYRSRDAGRTWSREGVVVAPGTGGKRIICDPSRVAGTDFFLYKTAD